MHWTLCFVVTGLAWTAAATAQDDGRNDLQRFQGAWHAAYLRNPEGQTATAEELKTIRLVVRGNEFTLTSKDTTITGKFVIDSTKKPKTIDFVLTGSKPDERFQGIYEICGDRRLSCFAFPSKDRPRVLRPAEKGYLLLEWKPAP